MQKGSTLQDSKMQNNDATKKTSETTVFYAGCFDPFTNGHLDVIKQALERFDHVIIGFGINEKKTRTFDREKMQEAVNKALEKHNIQDRVLCLSYNDYTGETALKHSCTCLIRGIKNKGEFDYELWLANYNRTHYAINTLFFLPSRPELEGVSSTLARELFDAGKFNELKTILPASVYKLIK